MITDKTKKLAYGVSSFETLINENYAYVDKTHFIEKLEYENSPYHFFIRPRKFGKSLFLSTLSLYYSRNEAGKFQQLFGNLYIGQHPTPKKNQYAVLNFNFSGINTNSEQEFKISFNEKVRDQVCEFLNEYRNLFPDAEALLNEAQQRGIGAVGLAYRAAKAHKIDLFAIVDEYDHFANDLIAMGNNLGKDVYDSMVKANGLVRDFYEDLKIGSSSCLKRIFITGISPVMLNDLTSGFNIAENLTLRKQYNEMLGFTHQEVKQLIEVTGIDQQFINIDLEAYYNGYKFHHADGLNKVYNPTMITGFLNQIAIEKQFPDQLIDPNLRTDYARLERLVNNDDNRDILLNIIKNGYVESDIVSQFSIDKMYSNEYFVSLLLYMGLLTIDGYHEGIMRLKVPNYSIQTLYWSYLIELIASGNPDVKVDNTHINNALRELAYRGNLHPFIQYISQHVFAQFSNRDLIQFDEKYIKAVLLCGILLSKIYIPDSEKEVENGYVDVFLNRNPKLPQIKYEWAWELKYIKATNAQELTNKRKDAIQQLKKYKQSTLLKDRTDVKYAAVLFVGKDQYEICEVE